ncbi:hypothetical protein RU639_012921 [Aspergillus parasiticus]
MAEFTCQEARQIVDEVAQRNGSITKEDRAATPLAVIKALQSIRNQLGSQRVPWTPCDEPDVRRDLVFQLISSTRSLRYNWAKRQGEEPYFSLDVSCDCMIIETNDDGWQKSDFVRLSENIAFLSNTRTNNLYGAVLVYTARIASKAHVQSGPFSFALGPQSPGDRLGFVTPVNKDLALLPEGVRTRIILYPVLPRGFDKFVDEFQAIATNGFVLLDPEDVRQPICKKFVFITRQEQSQTTRLTYEVQLQDGILEVTKTCPGLFSFSAVLTERFLLYKSTVPPSLDQVALLFPIDRNSRPVIRSQKAYHIIGSFAFPISEVDLNFVVCATVKRSEPVRDADIDTSTSIQNCVINSFCDAIPFCQTHSMTYGWVQYIPKRSTVSPSWHRTVEELIKKLRMAPVFQSQKGVLKSLSSLQYLSSEHYGGDNKPLFGTSDDYLSTKYSAYLGLLKPLGLQEISDHEVLKRVKPILTNPFDLRNDRMSLILRLLIRWLKRDPNSTLATEIRNIPFIQLNDGSFIKGNDLNIIGSEADLAFANGAVYFSTDTNGNTIPKCLNIRTVSENAVRDNDRKELFRLLGVRCACPEQVMGRISHHSHSVSSAPTARILIDDFMHILCYVYDSCAKDDRLKMPCLMIFDRDCLRRLLSDLFNKIISHHPDILLGVLGRHWDTYETEINKEPLIASAIKEAKVPTVNGLARLDECYFPIPEICSMVEAVSTTLNINFLKLPGSWGPDSEQEWGFLRKLGVSDGGVATFVKVIKNHLLSTMTLEKAKLHFFEIYSWISERPFDELWEFFHEEVVYIPNSGDGAKLVCVDQCVWHGPSWLQTMYALAFHEEYVSDSKIRGLFLGTLDVQSADWGTYMTELLHLQDVGVSLIEETRRIYQAIMEDAEDEDWESLRSQFRRYELIYVPGSRQWYAPQQCIWASFSIGDKMGIGNIYPDMESFFVEKLQVQPPSILCYISHIQHLCKHEGSVAEVIGALHNINSLKPATSELKCLKDINFLPIKGTEEEFYWGSVSSDFFIIDKDGWPTLFHGKVPTLQFHLAEVRELAPLLKSLGLENRFISICAAKKTSLSEIPSQSSLHLTTDFRQRSSGLSRCVIHYQGEIVSAGRELYDIFRKALVYETEHIVGECSLVSLSGASTSVQTYSRLHMEFFDGKLSIFVPPAEKERLICYATQLPESLVASLGINHPAAYGMFATVLHVPIEVVDDILGINGIPEVSVEPNSPVVIDDSDADYEDTLEEIFVPRASIAWGGKGQLLESEQSELQLVLRSKCPG